MSRSLDQVKGTFQSYTNHALFVLPKNSSGETVSAAELAAMYPTSLDALLDSDDTQLQGRYLQMLNSVNERELRGTLPGPLLSLLNGRASPHAQDFLIMHPFSRHLTLPNADMEFGVWGLRRSFPSAPPTKTTSSPRLPT